MPYQLFVYLPVFVSIIFAILLPVLRRDKPILWLLTIDYMLLFLAECNYIFPFDFDYRALFLSKILRSLMLLLIYPILTYFFHRLARGSVPKWKSQLLFAPAFIFLILSFLLYVQLGDNFKQYVQMAYYSKEPFTAFPADAWIYWLHKINNFVFLIFVVIQIFWFVADSWYQLIYYDRQIYKYYSDDADVMRSKYLRISFLLLIAVSLVNICYPSKTISPILLNILQLCNGILALIVGVYALRIRYTSDDFNDKAVSTAEENKLAKEMKLVLIDDNTAEDAYRKKLNDLYIRFIQQMENENLFLRKNLSLNDVCAELRTNRTYLSEAINVQKEGRTFSYIVNNYRLGYARALLCKEPNVDLEYVALKSGFSSYTSFYRACCNILNVNPQSLKS